MSCPEFEFRPLQYYVISLSTELNLRDTAFPFLVCVFVITGRENNDNDSRRHNEKRQKILRGIQQCAD